MSKVARPIAIALVVSLFLAACAAVQQQKAQAARADMGEFRNLQIFPQNLTHDELISNMRGFARALGTRCDHCHAANPPGSKEQFDFASDAKREKNAARAMLRMVRAVNAEYLSKVNPHGQMVTCNTCHRGHTVPDTNAPPAEEGPSVPPS
jgi:Photosynthetic reaction centre cytochrome C subunit.